MNQFADQAQRLTHMWSAFASKMAGAGMAFNPGAAPPQFARDMRDAYFSAMSSFAEEFMRSPEFLEMTRQSLEASMNLRQQFNDFLTKMHHGVQGVARQDVDSIMLAIRHMETRTLDRIEAIASRLEQIDQRLTAIENGGAAAQGQDKPAGKPQDKSAAAPRKAPGRNSSK